MHAFRRSWTLSLAMSALLLTGCSTPNARPAQPRPIVVQPRPLPCPDPGPPPPSPNRLGFAMDAQGRQCTADERVRDLWQWMVLEFEWSSAASLCLDRMRVEAKSIDE
jgi:hypothetical protein